MMKIKRTIICCLKAVLPIKAFKILKNLYRILTLDYEHLSEVFKLVEQLDKEIKLSQDAFERIKQRSIIVDGKLNYLLYGKANESFGKIDSTLIKGISRKDLISTNVDFTIYLRGPDAELKSRYRKRISNLDLHKIIDSLFLKSKSMLDLGAGNGHVTSEFYNFFKFSEVTGVDSYCNHFEAQPLKSFEYINTDVVSFLNFTNKKVYFLSAIHLLEHLSLSDQYYFFKQCFDILMPGGYLYIEVPNIYNYRTLADNFWADEQHMRLFPITAFRVLADRIGFVPYIGVYSNDNDILSLDEYLKMNDFMSNQYQDLFFVLRRP